MSGNEAAGQRREIGWGGMIGYSISEIGVTGMVVFGSFYFFSYMTNTLGIPPLIAGSIFFATKVFDVITDPLVGYLSDRTTGRMGPRRPWILAGAFVMGPALAIAFLAPFSADSWVLNAVWFSAFLMLAYLGLTLIGVPYGAMTAEMTENYNRRSLITSIRMWTGTFGILMGAVGYATLTANFGDLTIEGYRGGMFVILPLMIIPTLITVFATRNVPVHRSTEVQHGFFDGLKIALSSRAFVILALSYILMVGMITVVTSNVNAMVEYMLEMDQSVMQILSAALLLPTILAIPVWAVVAMFIDKKLGLLIGGVIYAIGMALIFTVGPGEINKLMLFLVVMGVAYAAYQIFPWSMLPDVISEAQHTHGGSLAGLFNGWWTTAQKFGIALGPLLAGVALGIGGYVPSVDGVFAEQTPQAIDTLRWSVSLIPALIFSVGVFVILLYPLGRKDQEAIAQSAPGAEPA